CTDYDRGKAAGSWCYELCVVKSFTLHGGCVEQEDSVVTFRYKGTIVRIPQSTSKRSFTKRSSYWIPDLNEPISVSEFDSQLRNLLHSKLGPIDSDEIVERIYQFADFSHDGEVSFGEANSIWKLLNNHEFFLIFLFKDNLVFPFLNGTCGGLYAYEYIGRRSLFNSENKTFLNYFFTNPYRWTLPDWEKRANIAVGLLEYGTTTSEIYNVKFLMCDLVATRFGHTEFYEPKLLTYDHIQSEYAVSEILKQKKCRYDSDCIFKRHCESTCNVSTGYCSPNLKLPSLMAICKLVREYLAFDAPEKIRDQLDSLLSQCVRISERIQLTLEESQRQYNIVRYNIVIGSIQELLWDQIENKPPNWLKPKPVKVVKPTS
ncbi:hypothetical protein FSP39_005048, partial [Pinctada imbricata]